MSFIEKRQIYFYTILTCFFCLMGNFQVLRLEAQTVEIRLGNQEISIQDMFEISVILSEPLKKHSGFPKISGFVQYGQKRDDRTTIVDGKAVRLYIYKQLYRPLQTGNTKVSAFKMRINGRSISHPSFKISVKKEGEIQDPILREFFSDGDKPLLTVESKAEAFFDITTDKKVVNMGEGFNLIMALYVKKEDVGHINFTSEIDLRKQKLFLLKKIKPKNCWEEKFSVGQPIVGKEVKINRKTYYQYVIFQATFFPLEAESITIPSVPFDVLKSRMIHRSSVATPIMDEIRKSYYSKEKTITVKPLPSHPLSGEVSVGMYELQERIQFAKVKDKERTTETGKNFAYVLRIRGEGNISAIRAPQPVSNEYFEFYPYSVAAERIKHDKNSVYGYRDFRYNIIPKKAGRYHLGDYISWVYFNTLTQKYDTLRSKIQFEAIGDEVAIYQADSLQTGLYAEIDPDNQLFSIYKGSNIDLVTNVSLLLLLSLTAFLTFKK